LEFIERERLAQKTARNRIDDRRALRKSKNYKKEQIEKEWDKRVKARMGWFAIILVLLVLLEYAIRPRNILSDPLYLPCCGALLFGLVLLQTLAGGDDWIKEKRIEEARQDPPQAKKKRVTHGWYDLLVKELYVFSGLFLIVVFLYAFGPDTWSWYEWGKIFPNSLGEKFFYGSCCIAPIIVLPFMLVYYAVRTS
jgi:hypothetical protein